MAFFPILLAAFLSIGDTACIDFKLEARAGFEIESPGKLAGELRLRSLSPKGDSAPLAPVALAGGKARACGPAGSEVEASASVSGYWIRRETVVFGPADSRGEAKLTLWPLGRLSGELKRPDSKTPAPREILVTTLPPRGVPRDQEPPKGQLSCPVDPHGRFRCELPAATYDLSFSLAPYAPVYRWQARVPAGRDLDLGSLALRRAASVAGWVTTDDGSPIDPRFRSDAEGQFHGVLPKDGPWSVEIQAADGEFTSQVVTEVEADRDGKASVSIDLPDTRLFGRVTLPEGAPAAEAWVMLQAGEVGLRIRADAEGRFNFRGLPPGSAFLQAERERSPGVTLRAHADALPLVADSSFGPVELRLAPSRTLRGRVVSPLGTVVSASLEIDAGDGLPLRSQARTDLSGEFSAEIPIDATRARIAVLAPGRALQAFVVPVDTEPTLNLSAEAGDVEVEAPWMTEAKGRERGMWIAVQNGILLPMPFLFQWVDLQNGDRTALGREGKLKIGRLPPASYQFCNLTMTDLIAFQLTGALPPGAVCAGGALAAGGTLRLEVPKPQRSGAADGRE